MGCFVSTYDDRPKPNETQHVVVLSKDIWQLLFPRTPNSTSTGSSNGNNDVAMYNNDIPLALLKGSTVSQAEYKKQMSFFLTSLQDVCHDFTSKAATIYIASIKYIIVIGTLALRFALGINTYKSYSAVGISSFIAFVVIIEGLYYYSTTLLIIKIQKKMNNAFDGWSSTKGGLKASLYFRIPQGDKVFINKPKGVDIYQKLNITWFFPMEFCVVFKRVCDEKNAVPSIG